MNFVCCQCNKQYPIDGLDYKCRCGGLFELDKGQGELDDKYAISLGEVVTPLVQRELMGMTVHLKLDYMMPTGSFKDRGALVMINYLKKMGIDEVVEDSSGNAGASIAAYCAAAGIRCNIYLPEATPLGKIKQISAYSARIVKVPGPRDEASKAVKEAAMEIYYASHVYNPLFFEGTKSIAYEIYSQIGVPDYMFIPVGNGTMLLGAYIGFKEIGKLPRFIGVQSWNCCPIYNKFKGTNKKGAKPTLADGIAVARPPRIDQIIDCIQKSRGDMVAVTEEEIEDAFLAISHMGFYTEPTSCATVAGALRYMKDKGIPKSAKVVIPLTGSGLKKNP